MFRGYLRWVVVSLVAIATVINYVDRNALAIMWVEIGPELGMDEFDLAHLTMVFMVGYAIGQALFGKIFDMIGTRFGFVLAIVIWSVAIMLHAVTRTFASLAAMRFTLAFGEAGNWPGATKSNAEWFPIRERALAQGIFNSGASLGAVISAPAIALLYLQFGWKATFVIIGLFGFLWLVPWLLVFKAPPERHPWLSAEEREHILTGQRDESTSADEEQAAPGWFEMLRFRQSWSVVASRFFLDPIWWLFVTWLPLYLAADVWFRHQADRVFRLGSLCRRHGRRAFRRLAGPLPARKRPNRQLRAQDDDHAGRGHHAAGAALDGDRSHTAGRHSPHLGHPVRVSDRDRQHSDAAERLFFRGSQSVRSPASAAQQPLPAY